jgi:DNA polymerase-3 subunit epsilon
LKARGYFWNGGEDGRAKAWHKEISESEREAEEGWLNQRVYRGAHAGARFDKVTAFDRFSKRG